MQTPTPPPKPHRIVIVDDHPLIRQGLTQLIDQEDDMCVVGTTGNAAAAHTIIGTTTPTLAIIDIALRGTSGIELTKALLGKHPALLVLIVSMYTIAIYAERALHAGARGYITKEDGIADVVLALRKVLEGGVYISPPLHEHLLHKLLPIRTVRGGGPASVTLSHRELEVLGLLGQGLSTRQIAAHLFVSIKTVESHNAHIKEKLGLTNAHQLIQHAAQHYMADQHPQTKD